MPCFPSLWLFFIPPQVKPEVKAFFAKTASAPAPEKPESLVKVAAGIKAVEVPKWPSEGEAKAISLYAGIKVAVDVSARL